MFEKLKELLSRIGEKHWNWKGGRAINGSEYIELLCRGHPRADKHGYVPEHILVLEKHIGRFLTKEVSA
jgi:hypothetical protein